MLKDLDKFIDDRGKLFAINRNMGFDVNRVFIIKGVEKNGVRGNHAHLNNKQLMICLSGEILVTTDSDAIILREGQSFFVDNMVWATEKYLTGEDILLVLCSTEYDEKDYIRNYEDFLEKKNANSSTSR
jgi:dTDP-4-dehydrorhamnose 3,5-epimerase-like enzyme